MDPHTGNWAVLHSLGLAEHTKRLYGEIDFLVIAPDCGVFCLEVKSGEVRREEGVWKLTNMFGHTVVKTRSPFQQAQEGMHSLKKAIEKEFGYNDKLSNLLYYYGVMFPHIEFPCEGTEYEPWQVYDRLSRRFPVSRFIKELASGAKKKVKNCLWFDDKKSMPTGKDRDRLVNFLRGDFERLITPAELLGDTEELLFKYTEEQYQTLDQLEDNPRCLFRGAAGTGKTMIAQESVRRSLFLNSRTVMFSYNILLGSWLQVKLKPLFKGSSSPVIDSFHEFLRKLAGNRFPPDTPEDNKFFKEDLPLAALMAIDEGIIEPFDKLIIDEGQDLIRPEYLDVFDAVLKGGLSGGKWEIYADFERQAIYSDYSAEDMVKMLRERADFTNFRLKVNCRNTRPIGEDISLLTGFESPPYLPSKIEGLPVNYYFYKEGSDQVKILESILGHLYSQKIAPENITILSSYKFENSFMSDWNFGKFPLEILTKEDPLKFMDSKLTKFSTIHSFKGLENSYIILTNINHLTKNKYKSLLYVGMSRARFGLYVLINKKSHQDYLELAERRK